MSKLLYFQKHKHVYVSSLNHGGVLNLTVKLIHPFFFLHPNLVVHIIISRIPLKRSFSVNIQVSGYTPTLTHILHTHTHQDGFKHATYVTKPDEDLHYSVNFTSLSQINWQALANCVCVLFAWTRMCLICLTCYLNTCAQTCTNTHRQQFQLMPWW